MTLYDNVSAILPDGTFNLVNFAPVTLLSTLLSVSITNASFTEMFCYASCYSLRIISSYNRGHSLSVVHRGVPEGNEIMQKFGGDAKKKIFLYLKRGRHHLCSYPPFDCPKLTVAA